jgi:hypothetical protein
VSAGLFLFATLLDVLACTVRPFLGSNIQLFLFFGSYLSVHCLGDDFIATESAVNFLHGSVLFVPIFGYFN